MPDHLAFTAANTFRYTPDFSRLSQQGKLAMVGFGLRRAIVGTMLASLLPPAM
ncbi:hypothetical protein NKI61_23235 [Mesorhizobium sp. M0514]|uniref:hypothetical protein n=1 Tax=Mesorhizobium sp. M0514 TaxID=2956955 RepID=UPI003336704E